MLLRTFLGLTVCAASACGTQAKPEAKPSSDSAKEAPKSTEKLEERAEKYPNGQVESKGKVAIRDGEEVRVGSWTYWYEDGMKAGELSFKDGKEDGPIRMWHPNGKERMSGMMQAGKPSGAIVFSNEKGEKERVESYRDGIPHGKQESWYAGGQIANRYTVAEGKLEGSDQGWYPNGKEMFRKSFNNDLVEGKAEAWYGSGSKRWLLTYSKGQLHGPYTRWYRDGSTWFEGSFANGVPDGAWNAYHHNRAPSLAATYASGKIVTAQCWSNTRKKRPCSDDEVSTLRRDYSSDRPSSETELEQFGEIYLTRLSKLKDDLCTCHDDACVQDVLGHMDKFAFEFQGVQPPPAADTQLKSIGREITACREALGSEYRGLYK